jgi:hypothetical protein
MCINITESVLLINHKTRGELSKYHNQRRLLRYIVDRDMSKKNELGRNISQMDINIQQVQARGVGFEPSSHDWGFLRLVNPMHV